MNKSLLVLILYLIIHIGIIFFIYPSKVISSTNHGHWIIILITIVFQFTFLWIYLKGLSYFPKQDLISIFSIHGKLFSQTLLFPLVVYFFGSLLLVIRAYAEIITIVFLENTPIWAISLVMILFTSYTAVKGFNTILLASMLIFFIIIPITLFSLITSFQNTQFLYIFPLAVNDFSFLTNKDFLISFFAVSPFLFLGFIPPFIEISIKKLMVTNTILLPLFLLSVYIPILTFSPETAAAFLFPFSTSMDTINIQWAVFDRITIFYVVSLITFAMVFGALLQWMLSILINRLYIPINPKWIILSIGTLVFILGFFITGFPVIDKMFYLNVPLRFYSLAVLPLIIFFLGLRQRRKKYEG